MKTKKIILYVSIIGSFVFSTPLVFASDFSVGATLDAAEKVILPTETKVDEKAKVEMRADTNVNDNDEEKNDTSVSTSSSKGDSDNNENKNDTIKTTSSSREDNSENNKEEDSDMGNAHRSSVANFVQSLLKIADHEGGIGSQVKVIAQEQNDSEKVTTDALVKIEKRGSFKTFLIGTDYKNIGVLRSQMVTTANQIDKLKKLVESTVNVADKIELQVQIETLEKEQVKIDAFIKANESKFSLFGWLFK